MEDVSDIQSLPLSSLTSPSRKLLSNLLNSTKVLPTRGPNRRHRDWRGLASLVNISAELEASIHRYDDKTAKVLEIWIQNRPATVGELLEHLATIDRFDVAEDMAVSIRAQLQQLTPANQSISIYDNNQKEPLADDPEILTYDDRPGHKHQYHAFVLYADADRSFVDEMKSRWTPHGFEICTIQDNLLLGHTSQYAPVTKLIEERCLRVILVISEDFFKSPANSFFMDFAQADGIRSRQSKVWPVMYKPCASIPRHIRVYTAIWYDTRGMFDFWKKLTTALEAATMQRVNAAAAALTNGTSVPSCSNSNAYRVELPPSDQSQSDYSTLPLRSTNSFISLGPKSELDKTRNVGLRNGCEGDGTSTVSSVSTHSLQLGMDSKKQKKPKLMKRIKNYFKKPVKQLC